jgi:hypothetical protein
MTRRPKSNPENDRDLIFICYSRADNENPNFCELLQRQFNAVNLAQGGRMKLRSFADTHIKPGARWRDEIKAALGRTRVAAILEGPGLMASEFVQENEIPSFLKAEEGRAGITVFRIPVRHVSQYQVPDDLKAFQAAWPLDRPLAGLTGSQRDLAMAKIIDRLVEAYVA